MQIHISISRRQECTYTYNYLFTYFPYVHTYIHTYCMYISSLTLFSSPLFSHHGIIMVTSFHKFKVVIMYIPGNLLHPIQKTFLSSFMHSLMLTLSQGVVSSENVLQLDSRTVQPHKGLFLLMQQTNNHISNPMILPWHG